MDMEAAVLRPPRQPPPPPPPPRRLFGDGKGERNSKTPWVIGEESLGRARRFYFRRCKMMRSSISIECLPNDMLSEILARLPADYLYDRARLVCRRWYHIICSYAFVNEQFQHATCGLLLCSNTMHAINPIFMTATQAGRVKTYELSDEFRNRYRLLNGCNGLSIEMSRAQGYLSIVNPATKQSLVLPPLQHTGVPHDCYCCIAFAASSMKYKLVMPYWNTRHVVLAILTVGVDNSWRNVEMEHVPKRVRQSLSDSAFITEGFMHWTTYKASLFTLDVETEILTLRKAPHPRGNIGVYHLSTGRFLSLLVAFGDFLWEIWGLNSETGEWRKVLPDIKLGALLHEFAATGRNEALRALLHEFASKRKDEVLVPLGWVKYPEELCTKSNSIRLWQQNSVRKTMLVVNAGPERSIFFRQCRDSLLSEIIKLANAVSLKGLA